MATVCPSRKTRMCLDLCCFILCFLFVIIQHAILDYFYLRYLEDSYWYAWIAGDVIIVGVMIGLLILAVRYNQRCMEETCLSDSNLKYAFVAWFVYSAVLAGKVAVTFHFEKDGEPFREMIKNNADPQTDNLQNYFGAHTYKLTLALSAIIFLLLVEAHHYTTLLSPRQIYLNYLATSVTLDILDSIYFLELLWEDRSKGVVEENLALQIAILALACLNFILPTFALLRLRFQKLPKKMPLPYSVMYTLFYILLVNVPYLVIRIFIWYQVASEGKGRHYDASIFVIKNLVFIYLGIRDVWTRIQVRRWKKMTESGSRGELTGPQAMDDDHKHGHAI